MATNFLELATTLAYLGAKWLLEKKKLILCPGWLADIYNSVERFNILVKSVLGEAAGTVRTYPGFCSIKPLGVPVFLLHLNRMLFQCRVTPRIKFFATVHIQKLE